MIDTMTENALIGVVAAFPDGEIRRASMPDSGMPCTTALKTPAIKVIEVGVYVEF
jgi:hypothetical protein